MQYAVLSFGGVLGMGDKLFAYPLKAFRPPSFEKNKWPNINDLKYRATIDRYGNSLIKPGRS